MTTTLERPAAAPRPSPGELRFVAVRANLMPAEVVSKRQTEAVRKQVLLGLLVVAVLLVGWYGLSWWQTSAANSDLHAAQRQGGTLQKQQRTYAPLVDAQSQTQQIQTRLHRLMTGDLSWRDLLATLRTQAPAGLSLTSVTGTITTGVAASAPQPGSTTGDAVGQLTLGGTARGKNDVAAYSDRLAKVNGLAAPLITNVTVNSGRTTFTMTVALTPAILGGRYSAAAGHRTGGK
jgi:Tfp pilus assembly protein PilN